MATRLAPEQDIDALDYIHHGLADKAFHRAEHVVDVGYVTPGLHPPHLQ
ncbi:hypothetical protein [Streptomyces albireticuli]|nr:hypothetical protein [Streptomyces albireticuli]MCD9146121.1 hypothetical protein [Streptomyces albireticuli]MCD9166284.1 hypothetical protein [Streptomyces albireticuli]MCD9196607.1 hypothetical protein [Streptomyces albireticuli]